MIFFGGGGAQLEKHPAQKVFDNGQKCHCTCIYKYNVVFYRHFCNILCSLQINLASADESTGCITGGFITYTICGAIRRSLLRRCALRCYQYDNPASTPDDRGRRFIQWNQLLAVHDEFLCVALLMLSLQRPFVPRLEVRLR